jgi:hypothetical protein
MTELNHFLLYDIKIGEIPKSKSALQSQREQREIIFHRINRIKFLYPRLIQGTIFQRRVAHLLFK